MPKSFFLAHSPARGNAWVTCAMISHISYWFFAAITPCKAAAAASSQRSVTERCYERRDRRRYGRFAVTIFISVSSNVEFVFGLSRDSFNQIPRCDLSFDSACQGKHVAAIVGSIGWNCSTMSSCWCRTSSSIPMSYASASWIVRKTIVFISVDKTFDRAS